MAILSSNSPLQGSRGLIGGLVFRTVGDKTVVSMYEPARKKKQKSELQQLTRTRFADASRYAKEVLRDPVKRAYYVRKAKKIGVTSAYTAAITDYMRRSRIERVDTSKLARKGHIAIHASKGAFDVARVTVRLRDKQGVEFVCASAVQRGAGIWDYRYQDRRVSLADVSVFVEAWDHAGHLVTT